MLIFVFLFLHTVQYMLIFVFLIFYTQNSNANANICLPFFTHSTVNANANICLPFFTHSTVNANICLPYFFILIFKDYFLTRAYFFLRIFAKHPVPNLLNIILLLECKCIVL